MIDLRQAHEYAEYMQSLGWRSLQLNEDKVYVRRVPLVGSVAKLQRPQEVPTTQQVKQFCKQNSVGAFYLEPTLANGSAQIANSFKKAKNSFVPAKTIHIDLTLIEQTLLKNMKPKTRYNIKVAERHVGIKSSTDIGEFTDMWKSSARERGMWLSQDKEIRALWDAFNKTSNADLLMAYKDDELLGGVLVCYSQDAAFYMYAGSTKGGKQLFAPTLLAWEAIGLAKKRKKKVFDFEGVYDSRYPSTKTWLGFTKFKEGFGGEVVEYPPTLVYYKNPLLGFLGI